MSCRTLVVALVLLASLPALAQVPGDVDAGADGGPGLVGGCVPTDTNQDGAIDEAESCAVVEAAPTQSAPTGAAKPVSAGPTPTPTTERRPKWTVEFETVVGQRQVHTWGLVLPLLDETVSGSSSVATFRYRPTEQLSIGAAVPFGIGRSELPSPRYAWNVYAYGHLGALALFGTWEGIHTHGTRIPAGLLVALPTWVGPTALNSNAPVQFAEGTRGFEDRELFYRGLAVVPSAAVLHDFGRVEVSASAKVPLRLNLDLGHSCSGAWGPMGGGPIACPPAFVVDVAGATHVMVKAVDRPGVGVSGGVRALALLSWSRADGVLALVSVGVAVEPRVEARLGALALRAGFIIPVVAAEEPDTCPLPACYDGWGTGRFPEAWGVRLGVGYSL